MNRFLRPLKDDFCVNKKKYEKLTDSEIFPRKTVQKMIKSDKRKRKNRKNRNRRNSDLEKFITIDFGLILSGHNYTLYLPQ